MKPWVLFAAIIALSVGCASMDPEAAGTLQVSCNVPDAAVLLDDELVGRAGELAKTGKTLRPGFYRVEIRQPGYYPFFAEVNVPEGGATAVKAELFPLLD
jgi:hypothetical protein